MISTKNFDSIQLFLSGDIRFRCSYYEISVLQSFYLLESKVSTVE